MHKVKINNREYKLPSHWNELGVAGLQKLFLWQNQQSTPADIKLKMLLHYLNAQVLGYVENEYKIKIGKNRYNLSAEKLQPLCDIFDFLFKYEKEKAQISSKLYKLPFPALKIGGQIYKGYDNAMGEMPFETFSEMLVYSAALAEKPEYISELIARIYSAEANDCARLPNVIKTIILWYWLGCNEFFYDKFPRTFSGNGGSNANIHEAQMKMIDHLAGNDLTKKQAVKSAPLLDALYTLECACEIREQREKELQKLPKK